MSHVVAFTQASQGELERKLQYYKHQENPCFYVGQGNPEQAKYKEGTNRRMYTREEREDAAKAAFRENNFTKALSEFVRAAELCIVRPSLDNATERADDVELDAADAGREQPPVIFATGIHTLFGNIAAVLTKLGRFEEAVVAADHAVLLNPEWAKGYFRKGAALFALGRFQEAVAVYDAGLQVEPSSDDLKQGRKLAVKEANAGKTSEREAAAVDVSKDEESIDVAGASGDGDAAEKGKQTEEKEDATEEQLSEAERYALKLEDFLEGTVPSQVKAALKRKREEDERAEQLLADASELSKTMLIGLKKNPQGDRWEDFFNEQRVR